jgi:hypothetical protein
MLCYLKGLRTILSLCVNAFEAKPLNVFSKVTYLVLETNDI